MFRDPKSVLSEAARGFVGKEHQQVWKHMPDERRALLKVGVYSGPVAE